MILTHIYNFSQNPVADVYDELWILLQPLLFGLIGTDIVFDKINKAIILNALGVLAFGLFVSRVVPQIIALLVKLNTVNYKHIFKMVIQIRFVTCCFILIGANLNVREIIFVNLAWLPKATVQVRILISGL